MDSTAPKEEPDRDDGFNEDPMLVRKDPRVISGGRLAMNRVAVDL